MSSTPRTEPYYPSAEECRIWWSKLSTPFEPTEAQWPIHTDRYRFKLVAGGERGGKSRTAAMFAIPHIPDMKLLWIVAKDYNLATAEFDYILDAVVDLGLLARKSVPINQFQPRSLLTKTGLLVRTITAADLAKLAMVAPDGIIAAEAAQLEEEVKNRLRGRVAQNRGWLLFEGTFENSASWYADDWEEWQGGTPEGYKSYSLPSWSNTYVYPGGWDDPEMVALRAGMTPERFSERHGGVPVPPSTAVFPEFRHDIHVGHAPYNDLLPVEIAVDPGFAGAYAVVAVQWDNWGAYVVDEIYAKRRSLGDIIAEVRTRPWYPALRPRSAGTIDIAGTQHDGRQSHQEIWASHPAKGGAGLTLRARYVPIEDGITRLRSFLKDPFTGEPRLVYNDVSTKHSVKEYKLYRYPEDQDGRPVREKPIDRDNHSVKALSYWLIDHYGVAESRTYGRKKLKARRAHSDSRHLPYGPYPGNTDGIYSRQYKNNFTGGTGLRKLRRAGRSVQRRQGLRAGHATPAGVHYPR